MVRRVIRLAGEKRSTFAKEKRSTRSNSPPRRFFAKPALDTLANLALSAPRLSEAIAISIIIIPRCIINAVSLFSMPMFTMSAIMYGMLTSTSTSPIIVSAAKMDLNR